jgi:hypothetical protein
MNKVSLGTLKSTNRALKRAVAKRERTLTKLRKLALDNEKLYTLHSRLGDAIQVFDPLHPNDHDHLLTT